MLSTLNEETRTRLHAKLQAYATIQAQAEYEQAYNCLTPAEKKKRIKDRIINGKPSKTVYYPSETVRTLCKYSSDILQDDLTVQKEEEIKAYILKYELIGV